MEFLEVPLYDDDLIKMMVRLSFNLVFVFLVIRFAYYQHQSNRNFVFTFLLMNLLIFFICFTLKKLDLGLGMALGLFAIFAIVRFRTDAIRVKEMTYLFLVIGLAVINALSNKKTSYAELLFTNTAIFLIAYLTERFFMSRPKNGGKPKLASQEFVYDQLELLRPERYQDLREDLQARTGFIAESIAIKKIDLSKGTAMLSVKYNPVVEGLATTNTTEPQPGSHPLRSVKPCTDSL